MTAKPSPVGTQIGIQRYDANVTQVNPKPIISFTFDDAGAWEAIRRIDAILNGEYSA